MIRANADEVKKQILEALEREADRTNVPWLYRWTSISHYYGDAVRQLLLTGAVLMLLTAPFYTDNMSVEMPFIVIGTIVLVAVSAWTSPWKKGAIRADAVVAGVGLVIFEIWAIVGYDQVNFHQFILREALALIFFFALYFSTKTLRAMLTNRIGMRDTPSDFHPAKHTPAEDNVDWRNDAQEVLDEINDRVKTEYTD